MNTNEMSIDDVIKSVEFYYELRTQLGAMRSNVGRSKNEILRKGGLTKRVMVERIDDMTASDVLEEFEKILLRKSDLPAAVRSFISSLCGNVFIKVFSKQYSNEHK